MNSEPGTNWPDGVRPITIGETRSLGVDSDRNIYWDGKPIQIRKTFDLSFWQKFGALLTVLSAVAASTVSVLQYFDVRPEISSENRTAETEKPEDTPSAPTPRAAEKSK